MSQHSTRSSTPATPPEDSPFAAVVPAATLETALDAVAVLVEECVVHVDEDGLSVEAMDPATVAMVSLTLSPEAFDSYHADGTALGVDLDRLLAVVEMADGDQPVQLTLDPETRMLHVRVGELAYTLALIDTDAIRSPPDRIDLSEQFTASVTADGAAVNRAVAAADMVSDHLELGLDEAADHLYARADGDTDTVSLEVEAADCHDVEFGPAHSLFSLQYLSAVDRSVPADRPVQLRLGEDAPLEVSFDLPDGDGSVRYVVSPRMTTN